MKGPRIRIALVACAALLLVLTGCRRSLENATLAYLDNERRVVLYDTDSREKVWAAKLTSLGEGAPAWSPDGEVLAFVCWHPSAGKWYLAMLEIDSGKETRLEIERSGPHSFEIGATIHWSPSRWFLSIDPWGSELSTTIVMDLIEGNVVLIYDGGPPLWSADAGKMAYVRERGRYQKTTCDLFVRDMSSGEEEVLFEGEPGYRIFPRAWTSQGTVIFDYVQIWGTHNRRLSTDGQEYEYVEPPSGPPVAPPGFPPELGRVLTASPNSRTGEWAVSVVPEDGASSIYLYMEGEKPSKIADGRHPVWRGS